MGDDDSWIPLRHRVPKLLKSIDELLKENYHLFAVMGVFGAISIYLSNFQQLYEVNSSLTITGILSSLFLFLLIGLVLNYKIYPHFDFSWVKFFFVGAHDTPALIIFLPLNGVVVSVALLAFNFPNSFPIFLAFVGVLLGVALYSIVLIVFLSVTVVKKKIMPDKVKKKYGDSNIRFLSHICVILIYIFIVGWGVLGLSVPQITTKGDQLFILSDFILFGALIQSIPHLFISIIRFIGGLLVFE